MRVLVTGGAGFIGFHVCDVLRERGHSPVMFDHRRRWAHKDPNFLWDGVFLGDVRDPVAVTEAMSHCDGWVHLAAVLGTQETIRNPRPAVETNIEGVFAGGEAADPHFRQVVTSAGMGAAAAIQATRYLEAQEA